MAVVALSEVPTGSRLRVDAVDADGDIVARAGTLVDRALVLRLAARKLHEVDVISGGEDWGLLPESAMRVKATYEERIALTRDDTSPLMNAVRDYILRLLVAEEFARTSTETQDAVSEVGDGNG